MVKSNIREVPEEWEDMEEEERLEYINNYEN